MTLTRCAMWAGVLIVVAAGRPVLAQADTPAAPDEAPTTTSLLDVAPADAWAVLSVRNLQRLDMDFLQLTRTLSLPIGLIPSGALQYMLGYHTGLDLAGAHGLIILDRTRFAEAKRWAWQGDSAAPLVVALSAGDVTELIHSAGGEALDTPGIWQGILLDEQVFIGVRGNLVLFHPDLGVVQAMLATQSESIGQAGSAMLRDACGAADGYVVANVQAILSAYRPVLQGMALTALAMAQADYADMNAIDEQAEQAPVSDASPAVGEPAGIGPYAAAYVAVYLDLLSMQVKDVALTGSLAADRLTVSGVATFPAGSLLGAAWQGVDPADGQLLAGLPADRCIAAMGVTGPALLAGQAVVDVLRPILWAMTAAQTPQLQALASCVEHLRAQRGVYSRVRLLQTGTYLALHDADGILGHLVVARWDGPDPLCIHFGRLANLCANWARATGEPDDMNPAGITYTPAVEHIGDVAVDWLVFAPEKTAAEQAGYGVEGASGDGVAAEGEEGSAEVADDDLANRVLWGEWPLKARIVRRDGQIVVSAGTRDVLRQALTVQADASAPTDGEVPFAQAAARLPQGRVMEGYLAPDRLCEAFLRATRRMNEVREGSALAIDWAPPAVDEPFAMAARGTPEAMQFDVVLPVRGIAVLKDLCLAAAQAKEARHERERAEKANEQGADEEDLPF